MGRGWHKPPKHAPSPHPKEEVLLPSQTDAAMMALLPWSHTQPHPPTPPRVLRSVIASPQRHVPGRNTSLRGSRGCGVLTRGRPCIPAGTLAGPRATCPRAFPRSSHGGEKDPPLFPHHQIQHTGLATSDHSCGYRTRCSQGPLLPRTESI